MAREYKHSGIEWIGEIPKEWDLVRAKSLFAQRNSKGNESAVLLSATQKQGMMPQSLLEGVVQVNNNTDLQTFKTVHVNDYVISLRSFQGGFEKSNYEGVCSPAYQVFYNIAPIDHNYYWLLFKSYGFVDKINSLTVGIREGKNIQYKDFANMILAVPPLSEQQKIANYLDKECGEVDEMIALQEQMIEELKAYKQSVITESVTKGLNPNAPMKDSAIDWIGEVPEHWEIVRLKFLCKYIKDGTHFSPTTVSEGYPYITATDVRGLGIDYKSVKKITHETFLDLQKAGCQPHKGDVLLVKDGATTGRVGMMIDDEECVLLSSVAMLSPNNNISSSFLMYFIMSDFMQFQIQLAMAGTALPRITLSKLVNFLGVLCPLSEQQSIASYLDTKCAEIDALIAIKQAKIDELKDYKKSVIYEYVTGKKEVE